MFNRRRYRKHPDTGKRSSVLNPPEDWIRQPAPALRIIDDELWERVQRRKAELSALPAAHGRKPKRLLSGLMKCSLCGSAMTLKGGKYICSGHYDRDDRGAATCTNGKIIAATTVERRVLAGVKTHLVSPEAIAMAMTLYQEAAEKHRRMLERERAPMEKEQVEIGRQLERAQVMFMEGVVDLDTLKARTAPLEARRQELTALLSEVEPQTLQLHPGVAKAYQRLAEDLQQALEGDAGEDLPAELRKLIERVDFTPADGLGKYQREVDGTPTALLAWARPRKQKAPQRELRGLVMLGCGSPHPFPPHTAI